MTNTEAMGSSERDFVKKCKYLHKRFKLTKILMLILSVFLC